MLVRLVLCLSSSWSWVVWLLVCHWSAYQRTTIDLGDGRECLATPVPARAWPGLSVVCLRAQEAHKKSFNSRRGK